MFLLLLIFFSFQKGTFLTDATSFSSNFCKISPAQQLQATEYFHEIKKKWSVTQEQFCSGLDIKYPTFNLNMLFENMIQGAMDGGGSTNPLSAQSGGFWD